MPKIIINGTNHELNFDTTDYEDICIRALHHTKGDLPKALTVSYAKGKDGATGSLTYGGDGVSLVDGMIFNVLRT